MVLFECTVTYCFPENRRDSLWHFMSNFFPRHLSHPPQGYLLQWIHWKPWPFRGFVLGETPPFMFSTKEQGSVKDSDSLSLHKTLGVVLFVSSLEIRQLQNELHQRLKNPTRLWGQGAMRFLFHVSTLPFPFFWLSYFKKIRCCISYLDLELRTVDDYSHPQNYRKQNNWQNARVHTGQPPNDKIKKWGLLVPEYFLIPRVKSFYNYSFYNSVGDCKTGVLPILCRNSWL